MFEGFALWVSSPSIRDIWLILSFAVAILPMMGLTFWYHGNIDKTAGGRKLMERQAEASPNRFNPKIGEGIKMARGIADGSYGDHAASMQKRIYLVTAIWLVANIFMFGLMIWGDELRKGASSLG